MSQIKNNITPKNIKDVAKEAGVSIATISRYNNHPELLRPATRDKVERAIEKLNYVRNRLASTLRQKSDSIGLIVPTIDNAIFAEMIQEFTLSLQEFNKTTLIATYEYRQANEYDLVRSMLERQVEALVLVGHQHEASMIDLITEQRIPILYCWNYQKSCSIPSVGVDNQDLGYRIAAHIFELGHKNCAYFFPDTGNNDRANERLAGVKKAAKKYEIDIIPSQIVTCPYNISDAKANAIAYLQQYQHQNCSAIIGGNDIIAQGALYGAQSIGYHVPNDISIAGIGDFKGSKDMNPSLSTIRIPAKRIGKKMAMEIFEMLDEKTSAVNQGHCFETELMPRGSSSLFKGEG